MTQPIIGIAGNQLLTAEAAFHGNQVTYTPQGFVDAVQQVGGLPFVLPIGAPETAAAYIQRVDKLILAGGQDVSPQFYHEEPRPKIGETNAQRDRFELALIEAAINQQKPIFAVCRGMQLLNVALGGSLYQDLSEYSGWQVKHEQAPTQPKFATHNITISEDALFASIFAQTCRVNSYHHQAVKDLGTNLAVVAHSDDGIVEAIQDPARRLLGVQWHPELSFPFDEKEQALFAYAVNEL